MIDLINKFESTKIPIVEIFQSISGEGVSAGNIVSFVRVAGCDLRCNWCDTKYSFNESGSDVELLLPQEIKKRLTKAGIPEIICTGGEPLEHEKAKRYLPVYLKSQGFKIRIETSGASDLYSAVELDCFNLDESSRPVYSMDIKCPSSGMSNRNNIKNIQLLDERDELKFVVADEKDLEFSINYIENYKKHLSESQIILNFSPVLDLMNPKDLIEFLKDKAQYLSNNKLRARLSLQLHKFIWQPHERGV